VFDPEVQMASKNDDNYDDFEDFDPDFLPGEDDFEFNTESEAPDRGGNLMTAWQKIEHRREMAWLRDQTADWDYWDDYLQTQ
jgi:hypothetical protein